MKIAQVNETPSPKPEDLSESELELLGRIPRQNGESGRPRIWLPDGSRRLYYGRPSSLGSDLESKEGLMRWGERMVLEGIHHQPSLLERHEKVRQQFEDRTSREYKAATQKISDEAKIVANAQSKADIGTALHDVTERIDLGLDPGWIPPEFEPLVYAYAHAMDEARRAYDMEIIDTELFMVNDAWKQGGTLDKLVRWKGKLRIADSKTSSTLKYSKAKFCIQLGTYAGGCRYDPHAALNKIDAHGMGVGRSPYVIGEEVDRETALIIHFSSDGTKCEFIELPIEHAAWGYETLLNQREWSNFWQRKDQRVEDNPLISIDGDGHTWQFGEES